MAILIPAGDVINGSIQFSLAHETISYAAVSSSIEFDECATVAAVTAASDNADNADNAETAAIKVMHAIAPLMC